MAITQEQLNAAKSMQLTKAQRWQLVRTRAEAVTGKMFDDITAAELATVVHTDTSLEGKAAMQSLLQRKLTAEYQDTTKGDFQALLGRWVTAGEPADWLRRQRGTIGLIEGTP